MPAAGSRPKFLAKGSEFKSGAPEAFGKWASAKVHFPPPDRLHEFLEIRNTDQLGVHVAATRDFQSRELVISEDPLVRLPEAPRAARQELERRFGARAAFLAPALSVDWRAFDEETRFAALNLFFVHPVIARAKADDPNAQVVKTLASEHVPLRERFGDKPLELLRFLHIVDLNIHKDDELEDNAAFTGIFVFGSKFSHSCSPNCSWSFSPEGQLRYHTLRPIKAGEILTFSYVGNGMNLVTSTLDRRRKLTSLWFVCCCERCSGPDLARRMRCPKCRDCEKGCLPEYSDSAADADDSAPPPQRVVPDAERWRCGACKQSFSAAEMPLKEESDLARLVPDAMMRGSSVGATQEARLFDQLRKRAASTVGPQHWTYILSGFAWLQRSFVMLRTEPIITSTEAAFQTVSKDIARWLEATCPNNSDQRFSALFVALRMENNLGGGLAKWGYDPADPLGAGLRSLEQLEAHGWRIVGPEGSAVQDTDSAGGQHRRKGGGGRPRASDADDPGGKGVGRRR